MELKLISLVMQIRNHAKKYPPPNQKELQMKYPYYGNDVEQSYIQVELAKILQVSNIH